MKPQESELLQYLRNHRLLPTTKVNFKRTSPQLVLEYGWWYESTDLPDGIKPANPGECLVNAVDLMLDRNDLKYREGYALARGGDYPTVHAWVTDGSGRAIDNTWPTPGVAYTGISFRSVFVNMNNLKNRAILSLLDDYVNGWPLRREFGDRPDEWLELKGQGVNRLQSEQA